MAETGLRRSTSERIEGVLALLSREMDAWLASADPDGTGYLIPLTFFWDGAALIFATPGNSRTARNLRRAGRTRIGLGSTRDVVMIDGRVELTAIADAPALAEAFAHNTDFDPRQESPEYVMVRVIPEKIQAWRTAAELTGRDIMKDGVWLSET
jgi:general stress protein 26